MAITRAKRAPGKPATADEFIAASGEKIPRLPPPPDTFADGDRRERAGKIVTRYVKWAAGAGLVPVPGLDLASITAVQLRMLAMLSAEYDVPFRQEAARSAIGVLVAALAQFAYSAPVAFWLVKYVPIAGQVLAGAVLPAFAAGTTEALGKVFITHFESGGTFLEFDPGKVREHFREEFKKTPAGTASA